MNEVAIVNVFYSADHLVGKHENSFHSESPGTKIEEVLKNQKKVYMALINVTILLPSLDQVNPSREHYILAPAQTI